MHFHQPRELAEALALKAKLGAEARFLAGGTDLVVRRNRGLVLGQHWIDLSLVQGLRYLREEGGLVRLGALTPHSDLEACRWVGLAEAAASVGGPQIRHRGTVGGNVGNASPAGDVSTALLALDAELVLVSEAGRRQMPLKDFFVAPGRTAIAPEEMIEEFIFPAAQRTGWFKLGKREATAISVVCAAVGVKDSGEVAIALGSVAPRPTRVPEAEAHLAERGLSAETAQSAGALVSERVSPITDHRATAEYRRAMAGVMVTRLLAQLA